MVADPPAGHLSNEESEDFLAPVSQLNAFIRDATSFRFVIGPKEVLVDGRAIRVFSFTNSMGSGASMINLYGNVGYRVAWVTPSPLELRQWLAIGLTDVEDMGCLEARCMLPHHRAGLCSSVVLNLFPALLTS